VCGRTLFDFTGGWDGTHTVEVPVVLRGAVPMSDPDPTRGSDPNKRRLVVVSTDRANATGDPTRTRRRHDRGGHQRHQLGLPVPGPAAGRGHRPAGGLKAQAEQVRSVSLERLGPVVARPPPLKAELEEALRLHLAL